MALPFAKHMDMTSVVVRINRNRNEDKRFQECQLTHNNVFVLCLQK